MKKEEGERHRKDCKVESESSKCDNLVLSCSSVKSEETADIQLQQTECTKDHQHQEEVEKLDIKGLKEFCKEEQEIEQTQREHLQSGSIHKVESPQQEEGQRLPPKLDEVAAAADQSGNIRSEPEPPILPLQPPQPPQPLQPPQPPQLPSTAWRDCGWNWHLQGITNPTAIPEPNPNLDSYVNYARQSLRLPPLLVTVPADAETGEVVVPDNVSDLDNHDVHADHSESSEPSRLDSYGAEIVATSIREQDKEDEKYTKVGATDSKYENYAVLVDPRQHDQAVEILLFSMSRPHMRGFHFAWISFFIAFFTWFAMTPLLSEIAHSLSLDRKEIWTSSSLAVAGSAVTRILIGPINDKYGARWAMSGTLLICAIPTIIAGAVIADVTSLYIVRTVIGVAGSSFVTCQYWTSSMFTREVSGTANALAAGWGNLGGGMAQIILGTVLFPIFKIVYGGTGFSVSDTYAYGKSEGTVEVDPAADRAWRTVLVFPAIVCLVMVYAILRHSDDIPKGNIGKRRKQKLVPEVSASRALSTGARNWNTWLLFIQYGCCFGVEITITNGAALYFKEEFGQNTETAAAVASVFGLMNLFARGFGGFGSDMTNAMWGMRGRLWFQVATLLCEGALVILFSITDTLAGAIVVMIFFSIFVQAAEGSTFGIVPYVDISVTGSIAGIVGAGGNVFGVVFSLFFRQFSYRYAYTFMGLTVMLSAFITCLIQIQGHRTLVGGRDGTEVLKRRCLHNEQLRNTANANIRDTLSPSSADEDLAARAENENDKDTTKCTMILPMDP